MIPPDVGLGSHIGVEVGNWIKQPLILWLVGFPIAIFLISFIVESLRRVIAEVRAFVNGTNVKHHKSTPGFREFHSYQIMGSTAPFGENPFAGLANTEDDAPSEDALYTGQVAEAASAVSGYEADEKSGYGYGE